MDDAIRRLVRERAGNRCEYCRLAQEVSLFALFHVDHIVAIKHSGSDKISNLALSCQRCNFSKGTNLSGIDPKTKDITRLFNPRRHKWHRHFLWDGPNLTGRTATGRATIVVLRMNDPESVREREVLMREGVVFP